MSVEMNFLSVDGQDYEVADAAARAANSTNATAIANEVTARENAVSAEATARANAISAETQAREAADTAINEVIAEINTALNDASPAIEASVSGDIASFSDGADGLPLSSLVVNIVPVQDGEGDPSPTNIRPISGFTGANIRQRNKNFCAELWADATPYGLTWSKNSGDKSIHVSGTSTNTSAGVYRCSTQFYMPKGSYVSSGFGVYGTSPYLRLRGYPKGSSTPSMIIRSGNGNFTLTEDTLCDVGIYVSARTTADIIYYPMIRLAPESDATYTPTRFQSYEVSWESEAGTIFGGTLDVVSGKLTRTAVGRVFTGAESGWSIQSYGGGKTFFRYSFSSAWTDNPTLAPSRACSHFPNALITSENSRTGFYAYTSEGNHSVWFNFRPDLTEIPDLATWKAWVAEQYNNGTPLTAYCPTETSEEYQLTPTEVKTLLGVNNIWADTGGIAECTYKADTKMYIDNKIAAIVATMSET